MSGLDSRPEEKQIVFARIKPPLLPMILWGNSNGLSTKIEKLQRRRIFGYAAYRWKLTISGFKGKGGHDLLDELVRKSPQIKWQDPETGYIMEEARKHAQTGRFAKRAACTKRH